MYNTRPNRHTGQSIRAAVTTDYWVVDESGRLADPKAVATLPGADHTDSPYSVAVETPRCETCHELEQQLIDQLASTVAAAHKQGCRLIAVGIRPDLLVDAPRVTADQLPPSATAGSRIVFDPDPAAVVDCYNVLLALDPAFVLLNTTRRTDGRRQYACGRPSLSACERAVPPYRRADSDLTVASRVDTRVDRRSDSERFQPVRLVDGDSAIEWRSLDTTSPTLLCDFIADIWTVLTAATDYEIGVSSFGNGFHRDQLVLPSTAWREVYTTEAIRRGLSSVLLTSYLERLGFETGWYRSATPPVIEACSAAEIRDRCRRRAELLDAEVGRRALEA